MERNRRRIPARRLRVAMVATLAVVGGALVPLLPLVGSGLAGTAAAAGAASTVPAKASPACAQPAAGSGKTTQQYSADGDVGQYVQEVPPSYTGLVPMPLVVDLHGYEEPASLQAALSGLGAYGAAHGFLTVTPQVTDTVPMWQTGLTSDDVKFIGSLLTHVEDALCVDENRVFVTGYSNGAFLTSSIACVYADRVAAVAPVAGLENPSRCHPARHIPIVAFHGTKDPFVSYTGGLGPSAMKLEAPDGKGTLGSSLGKGTLPTGPSIPSITASWASREGCASKPTDSAVATAVTLIRYQCPGGTEVELYRVTGGGHAWPGSAISASIKSVVGYTTMAISADQIMWDFFEAHPLRH